MSTTEQTSSAGFDIITPEVNMDSKILYLIRIDKVEMAFVNSEEEAKLVIDSIAAAEAKREENKYTEIYRKDSVNGNKVILSRKDLGNLFNSAVYPMMEIDYVSVGHAVLTKGRHELPSGKISLPPVLPPINALMERLAIRRAEAKGKSLDKKIVIEEEDEEEDEEVDEEGEDEEGEDEEVDEEGEDEEVEEVEEVEEE